MGNLCDWCNHRLMRLIPKYWRRDYIEDSREISSINAEARKGCTICRLLRESLVALQANVDDERCRVMTIAVPTLDQRQFTLRFRYSLSAGTSPKVFTFCLEGDNSWMMEGPIDATVNHGYQAQRAGALAFLPTGILDTRQEECIRRVREWIFYCKNEHPACSRQGLTGSHLPSRVIDVNYPPRLYESQGERAHYMTLSHCWGTSQHFVTTSENIQDLLTEIPWASLPKTFQDAISITRSLGIRFLWIDSLCIIQDKRLDWELELAKMGDNYKNSFLTIAAASAVDDQSGFLGPRETSSVRELPPIRGLPAGLMVREVADKVTSGQQGELCEPLYTRGWVLQERLLSPRILSFGSVELRWDCNSSTFTETGHSPPEDTQIAYRRDLFRIAATNSTLQPAAGRQHEMAAIYDWWHESLVPAYAKLKLTKQDDKLPALSAIAEEVGLRTRDAYLAGLWKCDLHRGLLWMCKSTGYLPDKCRAPSWSWASIDSSSITFEPVTPSPRLDARILDARFERPCANDPERSPSGYIRAEGICFEATLEASFLSETSQDQNISFSLSGPLMYSKSSRFFPDVPLEVISSNGEISTTLQRSNTNKYHRQSPISGTVWCFLVTLFANGMFGFMVLGRSCQQNDSWERLGLVKIHHLEFIPGWHEYVPRIEVLIV